MSTWTVSGYKATKQEISVKETEGAEHSQYLGEGSLCWIGIILIMIEQTNTQKIL